MNLLKFIAIILFALDALSAVKAKRECRDVEALWNLGWATIMAIIMVATP